MDIQQLDLTTKIYIASLKNDLPEHKQYLDGMLENLKLHGKLTIAQEAVLEIILESLNE